MTKVIFAILCLGATIMAGMFYAYMTEYGETEQRAPAYKKIGALVPFVVSVFISTALMCFNI